jgi:hypothetical protein
MVRHVEGLIWAQAVAKGPFGPQGRKKGAKARGLAFERDVAKALPRPEAWAFNPWYQFGDRNGGGYAQPDFVLRTKTAVLVLECKLTDTREAYDQLRGLYFPILEHVYGLPVSGIVIAKNLAPASQPPCLTFGEALNASRNGAVPLLHWLGTSSLR